MKAELVVSEEFAHWYEWLLAADPDGARELKEAVDEYGEDPEAAEDMVYDMCLSPTPRAMGFVAVHLSGKVLIATGAEIGESVRRCMTLLRRAEKVVRNILRGKETPRPWSEVRSSRAPKVS